MTIPKETLIFATNTLLTAVIIGAASTIARKNPVLAGFITALPLSSLLALSLAYAQSGDGTATAKYAMSILVALPASMLFFVPFLFYDRLRGSFWLYLLAGVCLLGVGSLAHRALMTRFFAG
ncbi:MAG: hypothetical protein ACK46X_12905 [Candidatus Sericytochromatia bacterium]